MPNRSLLMTETAERMNSHSKARKTTLMIVSAISDIASHRPPGAWTSIRVDPISIRAPSRKAACCTHRKVPLRLERMPGAVDLEYEWRPADGGFTRPATALSNASDSLRADGETTGRQTGVQLEADLDRAIEHIPHFAGMVA